jgi:hypothetical protein
MGSVTDNGAQQLCTCWRTRLGTWASTPTGAEPDGCGPGCTDVCCSDGHTAEYVDAEHDGQVKGVGSVAEGFLELPVNEACIATWVGRE